MDFEYKLIKEMSDWGLKIESINLTTGIYHRFKSVGICKKQCCAYRIFENQLGAHFKCFRRDINRIWFVNKMSKMDKNQKLQVYSERRNIQNEIEEKHSRKARECQRFFDKLTDIIRPGFYDVSSIHPYVRNKEICPFVARSKKKFLVLPIRDINYKLQSIQFIWPNGFKQYKKGGKAGDGMIWLFDEINPSYRGIIWLCEGYATGCAIQYSTGEPTICAMSAKNLVKVAKLIRRKFIHAKVRICGDDDQWDEKKGNSGRTCAEEANKITGFPLIFPDFKAFTNAPQLQPTDFCDLKFLSNIIEVRRQLNYPEL